jgi:hypothetical protein
MEIEVFIYVDSVWGIYKVTHKIDGIYIAELHQKARYLNYQLPEKIEIIHRDGKWESGNSNIGIARQLIAKIKEAELLNMGINKP